MPEPIEVISTEKIIVATADGIISATVGEVDLKMPIAIARYLALEILRNTFLYHQAAVDTAWANRESA